MKRILYLITSLDTGGAETNLRNLVLGLDRNRFEPVVVCMSDAGKIARDISDRGIETHCLNLSSGIGALLSCFRQKRFIQRLQPDLIHSWMYHANFLTLASGLNSVCPVIWGIRNSTLSSRSSRFSTIFINHSCAQLSGRVNRIVFNSKSSMELHVSMGYKADRCGYLPNGIDTKRFYRHGDAKEKLAGEFSMVTHNSYLVGQIARFDPQKDHPTFIKAAEALSKSVPDALFLFCGKEMTPNNSELTGLLDDAGIRDRCLLLGRRDDHIPQVMSCLDVLVSPSSYGEAFPTVIAEAMSCEVPVVTTPVGDSADIIGDIGRVFDVGDWSACAKILAEMHQNPEERTRSGLQARQRVIELYEEGIIIDKYQKLYDESIRTSQTHNRCEIFFS